MIREKFSTSSSLGGDQSGFGASLAELKKLDLFDLGVLLTVASTGGLDVIAEELINSIG